MILRVFKKTGATVWSREMMYKLLSQTVMLYGSESWVVTREMLKVLEGFHHQESIQITGMTAKHVADRDWGYPPVMAALEAAGLHPIQEYIRRRQEKISTQVERRPIYELCTKAEQRQGMIWIMRWWNQDVVHEYGE